LSSPGTAVRESQPDYPASLPLALLAFHRHVGPIRKQSEAKYGAFADLRTVLETITPSLLDQGLVLTQTLEPGAEGSCLLHTTLSHAPSGERISSSCPIPTLEGLLEWVHALRSQVLQRFPLDLPLAAIGALPPVLPPRNPEAQAELSAAPRQPGLRLDDQLRGLYTLLGQLGTTTNPLHALGGTITYLRRYQILALLCLAAEDNDGGEGRQELGSQPLQQASMPTRQQPAVDCAPNAAAAASTGPRTTSRSRTTRGRSTQAATPAHGQDQGAAASHSPRPAPTPAPAVAAVAAAVAPKADAQDGSALPALAPEAVPAASANPADSAEQVATAQTAATEQAQGEHQDGANPLTAAEVQQLIAQIRSLPTETIPQLVTAFRHQFQLPVTALVSDYIRTCDHAVFIRQQVAQLAALAV
jgi:hypothetical protein